MGTETSENVRNWLDVCKSLLIVVALSALLYLLTFKREVLKGFLSSMNVTKIVTPMGDIELKAADTLPRTNATLQQAQSQIDILSQQYSSALKALNETKAAMHKTGTPLPAAAAHSLQVGPSVLSSAYATGQQIQTAQRQTAAVIRQLPNDAETSMGYGIVFGADKDLISARRQLKLASAGKIGDAHLFSRQGYLRSVVVFRDNATAKAALASIQKLNRYSSSAYLVNMATWCPDGTLDQEPVQCGA